MRPSHCSHLFCSRNSLPVRIGVQRPHVWYGRKRLKTNNLHFFAWAMSLLLSRSAFPQTECSVRHTSPGVFICYPSPSEHAENLAVPSVFHLSAQGNALAGRTIRRYAVLIDGRVISDNRVATPTTRLPIEINLRSPFNSGVHSLRVIIEGAGAAQLNELSFYTPANIGFCEPVSSVETRTCQPSNIRGPMRWSIEAGSGSPADGKTRDNGPLSGYAAFLELYGRNLTSLEADTAEAVALDSHGNLYTASHSSADLELRKYAPDGSIKYDSIVRACSPGFLGVVGIAVDDTGRAWIAGNTNACIAVTRNALQSHVDNAKQTHGFVLLLDTTNPTSSGPVFSTYVSAGENRINAIRVDPSGNVYVAGITPSADYPHDAILSPTDISRPPARAELGFVSGVNASGSGLRWSTLLRDMEPNAIALDGTDQVYVTGAAPSRTLSQRGTGFGMAANPRSKMPRRAASGPDVRGDNAFVAAISDHGRRLSYFARFAAAGTTEGRAISIAGNPTSVVMLGETDSGHVQTPPEPDAPDARASQSFIVALQPCRTGNLYVSALTGAEVATGPEIATVPALDRFASAFRLPVVSRMSQTGDKGWLARIQIAPPCTPVAQ